MGWADGLAFCALIHHFFPQAFDYTKLTKENRKQNYELAFQTGERLAGIPDFISGDDMDEMISSGRLDPKVVFAYVQEVYRALRTTKLWSSWLNAIMIRDSCQASRDPEK